MNVDEIIDALFEDDDLDLRDVSDHVLQEVRVVAMARGLVSVVDAASYEIGRRSPRATS